MQDETRKSGEALAPGIAAISAGLLVMLFVSGVIPSKGASAPAWVGMIAVGAFVLAGSALVLRAFAGGDPHDGELPVNAPRWLRITYYVLGLSMIGSLAAIGTWVAFGPGERAFSMSVPFVGTGPADQSLGRTIFGIGTLITWGFFFLAAVSWWRKFVSPPGASSK
jgi:hypothetical protein